MLDHDELLPAEQEDPTFAEKLRALYQMNSAERQVLARVHQSLARPSLTLPVQQENAAPAARLMPDNSRARPGQASRPWLKRVNGMAAVLLTIFLIGALALTFGVFGRSFITTTGGPVTSMILVPAQKDIVLSQHELQTISTILTQRLNSFGLDQASVQSTSSHGQPALLLKLPGYHPSDRPSLDILLQTGKLAFWGTGSTQVSTDVTFDPSLFAQENPGGKPPFTGQDLNPASITVEQDQSNQPVISFSLKSASAARFRSYTGNNIGNYLTITFDGKVIESAVIQAQIDGTAELANHFTLHQAQAIAADLKSGALSVALVQVH